MTKRAKQEVERALVSNSDMAYVFRKINEMGKPKPSQPVKVDNRPAPQPIKVDPVPEPVSVRSDPKPLEERDKVLDEILRMWPLLSQRDKLELQGIVQLKVYLNSKR